MTLSIAYVSGNCCVVATDRRISGGMASDEHSKTIALFAGDGIASVSFAGLAKIGYFDTHDWLANTLKDRGGERGEILQIIRETKADLTARFKNNVTLKDHRLSVLFAGYGFTEDGYRPFAAIVTNFQHPLKQGLTDDFEDYKWELPVAQPGFLLPIGDYSSMPRTELRALELATVGKTQKQLQQILVGAIRKASKRSPTVGEQITTVTLDPNRPDDISTEYHSAKPVSDLTLTSTVWAQPGQRLAMTNGKLVAHDDPTHVFVPPGQGRNSRCACGSGKKYKRCHGQ